MVGFWVTSLMASSRSVMFFSSPKFRNRVFSCSSRPSDNALPSLTLAVDISSSLPNVIERNCCAVRKTSYSRSSTCLISTDIRLSMPTSASDAFFEMVLMSRSPMIFITLLISVSWLSWVASLLFLSAITTLDTIACDEVSSTSSTFRHDSMRCCRVPTTSTSILPLVISATRPTSPIAPGVRVGWELVRFDRFARNLEFCNANVCKKVQKKT